MVGVGFPVTLLNKNTTMVNKIAIMTETVSIIAFASVETSDFPNILFIISKNPPSTKNANV